MRVLKWFLIGIVLLSLGGLLGAGYVFKKYVLTPNVGSQQTATTPLVNTGSSTEEFKPVTITADQLTPGQRKVLETLGIDTTSVMVTAEMMACAETGVGSARYKEIVAGATPSIGEGLTLLACFKQQ